MPPPPWHIGYDIVYIMPFCGNPNLFYLLCYLSFLVWRFVLVCIVKVYCWSLLLHSYEVAHPLDAILQLAQKRQRGGWDWAGF
jgi:hypothetical protein